MPKHPDSTPDPLLPPNPTPTPPTPPPVFPPACIARCSGQMTDERKLALEASTQGRAGHPATRRGNCGNRTHGVARPWAIAATRFEWRVREQVKEKSWRTPRAPSTPWLYTCNTRRTGGLCPVIPRCRADGLCEGPRFHLTRKCSWDARAPVYVTPAGDRASLEGKQIF